MRFGDATEQAHLARFRYSSSAKQSTSHAPVHLYPEAPPELRGTRWLLPTNCDAGNAERPTPTLRFPSARTVSLLLRSSATSMPPAAPLPAKPLPKVLPACGATRPFCPCRTITPRPRPPVGRRCSRLRALASASAQLTSISRTTPSACPR